MASDSFSGSCESGGHVVIFSDLLTSCPTRGASAAVSRAIESAFSLRRKLESDSNHMNLMK